MHEMKKKSIIVWKKKFLNFSADFVGQKFCLTKIFTQIHSFRLVCISMLVYFELTMILHDFLHFSNPQTMSALMNKKNASIFQLCFSVYMAGQMPKYCSSRHIIWANHEINFATGEITCWGTSQVSLLAKEFSYPSEAKRWILVKVFHWIYSIYEVTELSLMTVWYQISEIL